MEKGGVEQKGGAEQKDGVEQKGGAMGKGGVDQKDVVEQKDGAMGKGGVDQKDVVEQKGGAMEKGGVEQNCVITEKGGEVALKSTSEFPVSEHQTVGETESATHLCELCGMCFETRRGLSSHARSHLRQLGVCVSESSGAPISLLYELITERDGSLPFTPKHTHTHPTTTKHTPHSQHRSKLAAKHGARPGSGTKLKIRVGDLVKRACPPAALRDSSSSSSSSSSASSSPLHHQKTPKTPPTPHPAPTDTVDPMEFSGVSQRDCVHVCELCGAWYETNKSLVRHARAHLRHFGVALDPKAAPLQVLHELLQKEVGTVSKGPPTAMLTPPLKKRKLSPGKEKQHKHGDSLKTANCEFCGEKFKSTQSLASHARSHLRQLGVTDWSAHGSPVVMLRELMARGTVAHSAQTTPLTPPQAKSPSEAPPLPAPGSFPSKSPKPPSEAPPLPVTCSAPVRVPKARKGSRLAVSKPKDEPVELDISTGQPAKAKPPPPMNVTTVQSAAGPMTLPSNQNLTTGVEVGVAEPVRCEYCGDLFDSRKALSCHARAHLRQLAVKWAPFASPIDTLYELMFREGRGQGSEGTPSPVDFCREKTETDNNTSPACEATCELCGFDFENRKALASHCRAHLRQQGEQWSSSQSPIAALSQWMSREPEKVAALHRLYMQGTLPHIRKRRICSPVRSADADFARSSVSRPSPAARQGKTGASLSCSSSFHRKVPSHRPAPHSTGDRGSDRWPPKLFPLRMKGVESLKRVGNAPSLVPRPPETSLVKVVGKIYSLKCRFCERVFSGPLSVQEDWLIHLRHHILNLKPDRAHSPAPILPHSESARLIGQAV